MTKGNKKTIEINVIKSYIQLKYILNENMINITNKKHINNIYINYYAVS
jgi:hypothetical protein